MVLQMHRRKLRKYEREKNCTCTDCPIALDALKDRIWKEAYKAGHDDMADKVITAVMTALGIIDGVVSVITLVGILQRVFVFYRKKDCGSTFIGEANSTSRTILYHSS
jgi:hypothetical protein